MISNQGVNYIYEILSSAHQIRIQTVRTFPFFLYLIYVVLMNDSNQDIGEEMLLPHPQLDNSIIQAMHSVNAHIRISNSVRQRKYQRQRNQISQLSEDQLNERRSVQAEAQRERRSQETNEQHQHRLAGQRQAVNQDSSRLQRSTLRAEAIAAMEPQQLYYLRSRDSEAARIRRHPPAQCDHNVQLLPRQLAQILYSKCAWNYDLSMNLPPSLSSIGKYSPHPTHFILLSSSSTHHPPLLTLLSSPFPL
jgi:hypothetical protein